MPKSVSLFVKITYTAVFVIFACTASASVRLTLSHNQDVSTPVHQAMQSMADEVNKRSAGELTIRIYPNGQLGSQRESMELMQFGAIDMVKSNASELEAFAPVYGAFNLPYLFADRKHFYSVLSSPVAEQILNSSADRGFVGLNYYDGGSRSFYANIEIRHPRDLQGLKIRVQPSPSAISMMHALGGAPTPLAYSELYTALQQGVVDGAENSVMALTKARHGEVAKIYSRDEHTRIPDVLLISVQTLSRLTDSQQHILRTAAKKSMWLMKELWAAEMNAAEQQAIDMGVRFIDVDKQAFQDAVEPLHEHALQNSVIAPIVNAIKKMNKSEH